MADWSDLTYDAGEFIYPDQLQTQTSRMNAVANEVYLARLNKKNLAVATSDIETELTDGRQGEVSLVTNLTNNYFSGDLNDLQGGKFINSSYGVLWDDGITLEQAIELSTAWPRGDVSFIPVTSLSSTVGSQGYKYVVNANQGIDSSTNSAIAYGATGIAPNEGVASGTSLSLDEINTQPLAVGRRLAVTNGLLAEYGDDEIQESAVALFSNINF